jgi:hypothetical protein
MPNCDFYAFSEDVADVLGFVFAQPGWELHELASRPDSPVRVLRSSAEASDAFDYLHEDGLFHIYSPDMKGYVVHKKILFKPGAVPGASFRFSTEGWGLIQLYFGSLRPNQGLRPSHTNHNSLARARKWSASVPELGDPERWDWSAISRASGRLNRFLRNRAVAKHGSRPILPGAHAALLENRFELLSAHFGHRDRTKRGMAIGRFRSWRSERSDESLRSVGAPDSRCSDG